MTDITNHDLGLAILDQNVAGMFGKKPYAYVAVCVDDGWQLGVAVANERGYHPVPLTYATQEEAHKIADGMNRHIGVSDCDATAIQISTMGGRPYYKNGV